eukprot:COSAG05_NODE_472_length_9495_cov_29.989783_8_plen_38_part_00
MDDKDAATYYEYAYAYACVSGAWSGGRVLLLIMAVQV